MTLKSGEMFFVIDTFSFYPLHRFMILQIYLGLNATSKKCFFNYFDFWIKLLKYFHTFSAYDRIKRNYDTAEFDN